MTISFEQAKLRAEKALQEIAAKVGYDLLLYEDESVETEKGWVFFFNSKEFIETGNPGAARGGNGPIFINRSGDLRMLPSAVPWETALDD